MTDARDLLRQAAEHLGDIHDEGPTYPDGWQSDALRTLRDEITAALSAPDDSEQMLRAYSAALDEVFALRRALAYESRVIAAQTLDVKALGKGRREQVEQSVERMAQAAKGDVVRGYAGTSRRSFESAIDEVGGANFLTRASWEQEVFGDPDG